MPTLLERIGLQRKQVAAPSGPPAVVMDTPATALYTPKNVRNFAQYGYMGNGVVYRAVSLVAQTTATIPLELYRTSGKRTKLEQHDLLTLLNKPNAEQAKGAFFEALISHWIISGTSYFFGSFPGVRATVEKPAKPLALYMLRPDLVTLNQNAQGDILGYKYQARNTTYDYPLWKVHPIRFFHPLDDFYGLSPVLVAAAIVDRQNEGEKYNIALMQHAARPAGAFIAQGNLSDPARETLKAAIKRRRGWRGAGEELLLEGGLQYVQMGLGPAQLSWLDGDANAGRKIAMILGVDPLLLNDKQFSTYNNVREARLAMIDLTCLPVLGRLVDEMNGWLVPWYGLDLELAIDMNYVEALKEDKQMSASIAVNGWNAGGLTWNEMRRRHGEEELPDGDFLKLGPAVFVRTDGLKDFLTQQEERRAAPPIAPGGNGFPQLNAPNRTTTPNTGNGKVTVTEVPTTPPGDVPAKMDSLLGAWEQKAVNQEKRSEVLAQVEALRQPYIDQMQEHMQQFFIDLKMRALVSNQTGDSAATRLQHVKSTIDNAQGLLQELLMHYYTMVAGASAQQIGQQFKRHVSIWKKDVAADMGAYIGQAVESIAATTSTQVTRLFEQKTDPSDEELNVLFDSMADYRAEGIAAQSVVAASNMGSYYAALQTGMPLYHTWIATDDDRTRYDHAQADGQKQYLEAPYEVGDNHYLLFPGDTSMDAPLEEIMRCRCCEAYSLDEHPERNPYWQHRIDEQHKGGMLKSSFPFFTRWAKYNPYHDPHSGRFAGRGGASGGVTVATTIDAAISLLGQGKGVMFDRPEKAVTLLHELANIALDAKAKGEKAPVYDLCKVSVKGTNLFCAENVGIPRKNMPQLKGVPTPGSPADNLPKDQQGEVNLGPAFKEFLRAQGHTIEEVTVPASQLRASQTELNGTKVAGMMVSLEHGLMPAESIFASTEQYVIDGHHRWAANVGYGLEQKNDIPMPISRLDMPILDALKMANNFAESMGIPQAAMGQGAKSTLTPVEYMLAYAILQLKFNPYHDRQGRFASGTGLGIAAPGQAELPGMPIELNPQAFRQPALFAPPGSGRFTQLVAPPKGTVTPDDIGVNPEQLMKGMTSDNAFGDTSSETYKINIGGETYFAKRYPEDEYSNAMGFDGWTTQGTQDQIARDLSKIVGVDDATIPLITWEAEGRQYMAQKWLYGMEDSSGYSGKQRLIDAVSNESPAHVTAMHLFEYATGDFDHFANSGNTQIGPDGKVKLIDFSLAFHRAEVRFDGANGVAHYHTLLYGASKANGYDIEPTALADFVARIPAMRTYMDSTPLSQFAKDQFHERMDNIEKLSKTASYTNAWGQEITPTWDDLDNIAGQMSRESEGMPSTTDVFGF